MGAQRPFFVKATAMADTFTKEKALEREISQTVERDLPGTEVLAVELLSPARFCEALRAEGVRVETGVFGARMELELVNDGPVTIVLDV